MPLPVFRKAGEDENIFPIESRDYYFSVLTGITKSFFMRKRLYASIKPQGAEISR